MVLALMNNPMLSCNLNPPSIFHYSTSFFEYMSLLRVYFHRYKEYDITQ